MRRGERVVRFLASRWGIPLLSPGGRGPAPVVPPGEVVLAALRGRDARLVMATVLYLSLVAPGVEVRGDWSEEDRRRIGYLCDAARCLRALRGGDMRGRPRSWAERVARLRAARWPDAVPVFDSAAPVLAASMFGRKWMVEEVIAFSDFAAFQGLFVERSRAPGRAA